MIWANSDSTVSGMLLGLGAVAFVLYDIFLGLYYPFYEKVLKPKISKRMK